MSRPPIGKTRQSALLAFDSAAGPPRGILRSNPVHGIFLHSRRSPSPNLAAFILHYWFIEWNLAEGQPQTVETLPHPNVHLVFTKAEADSILIHGVHTKKFVKVLHGFGRVFGVKFRPGGFRAFYDSAVASLRDATVEAQEVFGQGIANVASELIGDTPKDAKLGAANRYFTACQPKLSPDAGLAGEIVAAIQSNPAILNVRELSASLGVTERSLQRLFREYVGASPKWVIRRYRLHELVERLNSGDDIDWAAAALALGYYDQSHLIQDFRRTTGYTPESYRRKSRTLAGS